MNVHIPMLALNNLTISQRLMGIWRMGVTPGRYSFLIYNLFSMFGMPNALWQQFFLLPTLFLLSQYNKKIFLKIQRNTVTCYEQTCQGPTPGLYRHSVSCLGIKLYKKKINDLQTNTSVIPNTKYCKALLFTCPKIFPTHETSQSSIHNW